jgi:zinc/manganese transport system substrate-binding protein
MQSDSSLWRRIGFCLAFVAGFSLLAACGSGDSGASGNGGSNRVLQVVAAENFWGSLASQLGGKQAHVTSIVSDPNADPHEYSASTTDARLMATADFAILNGAGYDSWASDLLNAQASPGRLVFTVGTLVGKSAGDNPHLWYDPAYVLHFLKQCTADYKKLEPSESAYFNARYSATLAAFQPYDHLISYIQKRFSGTPIAATESVFQYMAGYLHLDLVTPSDFMKAVAEGNDPPMNSEATFYKQIQQKAFKVLVYNVQTVTPLTTNIRESAVRQNIGVIGVSETIQPPIDTFQEWMDGELSALANALNANALGH